jgi:hypothetical protein
MRNRRQSKGKVIRPTFFVFCEGESEEAYVKFLRSKYRLPIEICPSVAGLSISPDHIKNFKKNKPTDAKDKDYLMYDLDREDILERLERIKGALIIASNPCLELWYLLHFVDQKAELSSSQCLSLLKKHFHKYRKGEISKELQSVLTSKKDVAISRARALSAHSNPSSDMPVFIEDIESASK